MGGQGGVSWLMYEFFSCIMIFFYPLDYSTSRVILLCLYL
jgi:hypothetical protein